MADGETAESTIAAGQNTSQSSSPTSNPQSGSTHAADQTAYKGRSLPVADSWRCKLDDIPQKLAGWENYEAWCFRVERMLMAHYLYQLIDSSIPRPQPDNPLFERWEDISLRVGFWLKMQLGPRMQERFWSVEEDPGYADEVYDGIKRIIIHQEMAQLRVVCVKAATMMRNQFGNATDYVSAFREATAIAHRIKVDIRPVPSALLLLHNLREDLPNWAEIREYGFTRDVIKNYQWNDFRSLCGEALDRLSAESKLNAAVRPQKNNCKKSRR